MRQHTMMTYDALPDEPSLRTYWEQRQVERGKSLQPDGNGTWQSSRREYASSAATACITEKSCTPIPLYRGPKAAKDSLSNLIPVHLYGPPAESQKQDREGLTDWRRAVGGETRPCGSQGREP
ncbi:hypothetical protein NKDENANG_01261 [Candidatus Entotheonellaceae bacterium PAL068K]